MATVNSNSIEIDIIGNIAYFENSLIRGISRLHNFFNQAQKLAKDSESEAKASSIRAAKLMQESMEQRRRLYLAMHNDEASKRNKESSDIKNAEAKKLTAYQSFFRAADNLTKQHAQNQVRREEETTNRLLANFRKRAKDFEKYEKEITDTAKKQSDVRRTVMQSIAHTIPFGIGRTVAFAGANAEAFAIAGGMSAGNVEAFSAAIAKIPIPVVAALAAAFIIVKKSIDLAKQALFEYIIPAIRKGLEYNDLIENSKYGIAGIVSQLTEIYRGQQLITEGAERWVGALNIADDITVDLQNVALKTKAVYQDLARGMQEGFAPMLQMGARQDQITPFVTRFVHLMATLRIPLREIGQEMRAFGSLDTNPRTARASFAIVGMAAKQMGISFDDAKAKLKSFAEDGTLIQWMLDNTKEFQRSGEAAMHTLSGQLSNVKELWDRILGEGTKGLYDSIKTSLDGLIASFVTFDKEGNALFSQEAVDTIKSIADVFQSLIPLVSGTIKLLAGTLAALTQIKDVLIDLSAGTGWVIKLFIPDMPEWLKNFTKESSGGVSGGWGSEDTNRLPWYKQLSLAHPMQSDDATSAWDAYAAERKRINDQYRDRMVPLDSGLAAWQFKNGSIGGKQDSMFNFQSDLSTDEGIEAAKKAEKELTDFIRNLQIKQYADAKQKSEEWVKQHEAATKEVGELHLALSRKIEDNELKILQVRGVDNKEKIANLTVAYNEASKLADIFSALSKNSAGPVGNPLAVTASSMAVSARVAASAIKELLDAQLELAKPVSPEIAAFRQAMLNAAREYDDAIAKHKERLPYAISKSEIDSWNKTADAIYGVRVQAEQLAAVDLSKHKVEDLSWLFGKADKPINASINSRDDILSTAYVDNIKKTAEAISLEMERAAEKFNEITEKHWRGPMSSVFADLGKTGGRNFLNIMQRGFDTLIEGGAAKLTDYLANWLGFGGTLSTNVRKDDAGNIIGTDYLRNGIPIGKDEFAKLAANQKKMQGALMVGQVALGSYQAGATNQKGAVTSSIIGGFMAGVSTGNPWIAVGLAIVGGISAAIGKAAAREEYKWAEFFLNASGAISLREAPLPPVEIDPRTGKPRERDPNHPSYSEQFFKNIEPPEMEAMLARLQSTFDTFWGGYTELAIKVAAKFLPKLSDIAGVLSIQENPSANFLKHFEEFLAGTLPDEIMTAFQGTLKEGFVGLGMSAAKFEQVFAQLNKLDPTKALEMLNMVADTLINFKKIETRKTQNSLNFLDPTATGIGGPLGWAQLMMQVQNADAVNPVGRFTNIDEQIRNAAKLSEAFGSMTSEQQIRAAFNLSELTAQRIEMEQQFAREMIQFLQDSGRTFDAYRRQLNLEGMGSIVTGEDGTKTFAPNYQEQANYLKTYLDKIMIGIGNAANPDQLAYWQSEFFATIQQMGSIYQQMGPEAYEAFRVWMLGGAGQQGVLDIVQGAIAARVNAWGTAIADSTQTLFTQIQPSIDIFKTIVTTTGNVISGTDGKLVALGTSVDTTVLSFGKLSTSIDSLVEKIDNIEFETDSNNANSANTQSGRDIPMFTANIRNRRLASTGR